MATIHQIFIWISHKDIENVNEMLSQILKTDAKMRALIPKLAQSSDASAPTLLECFLDWFKKRCCKYILRWCMYMYMLISRVGSEWSKAQTEDWRWLQGTSTIAWWYRHPKGWAHSRWKAAKRDSCLQYPAIIWIMCIYTYILHDIS